MAKTGPRSKLAPEQWARILHRYLVDGESASALGREFGVDEANIRRRAKASPVPDLAVEKATSDVTARRVLREISELSEIEQETVMTLAERLAGTMEQTASAAHYQAMTANRISQIAHAHSERIDPMAPTGKAVEEVAALVLLANKAAEVPVALLKAPAVLADQVAASQPPEKALAVRFVRAEAPCST